MKEDKAIRFGWFVRRKQLSQGIRLKKFAADVELSTRRVLQIQKNAILITDIPEGTADRFAIALGMTIEQLEQEASTTPVAPPRFKDSLRPVRGPKVDAPLLDRHRSAAGEVPRKSPPHNQRQSRAKKS